MKRFFWFGFVFSYAFSATSLQDLLTLLFTNNSSLRELRSEQRTAYFQYEASLASLWQPSVRLASELSVSEGSEPSPHASLTLSKSFNLGGKEWFTLKQIILQKDLLKKKETSLICSLKKDLISAYFTSLCLESEVEASQKNYELALKKAEYANLQYSLGKISLSSFQEQQNKVQEAYLAWQQKKQSLQENLSTISSLVAQDISLLSPSEEELSNFIKALRFSTNTPLFERDTSYLSLLYTLSNASLTTLVENATSSPDISLGAGYQVGMGKEGLQGRWTATLSLSLDPFSWLPGSASFFTRQKNKENISNIFLQIEEQRYSLQRNLRLLHLKEGIALDNLSVAQLSLESASRQLLKAQEEYNLGQISALDLLATEASYLSAKASTLSALVTLLTIRCELAFWYDTNWQNLQ